MILYNIFYIILYSLHTYSICMYNIVIMIKMIFQGVFPVKRDHPRATSALGGVPPDGAPRLNEVSCRAPSPYRECHWPKSAGLVPTKFDVNHQFLGRQTWVILCADFADSADSLTFPRVSGVLEAALLWCVKHPALFASGKRCERMRGILGWVEWQRKHAKHNFHLHFIVSVCIFIRDFHIRVPCRLFCRTLLILCRKWWAALFRASIKLRRGPSSTADCHATGSKCYDFAIVLK